jgi:hypothetical protein
MEIKKHIVKEDENYIEPAGFPIWIIEFEGEVLKDPNTGRNLSFTSRKLAEVFRYKICVIENEPKKSEIPYFHITHVVSGGKYLSLPEDLELIIIDELLKDKSLRQYLNSEKCDESTIHIDSFFRKYGLEKFKLEDVPVNYPKGEKYKPSDFSKKHLNKVSKKSLNSFLSLYDKVINDNVNLLGAPDLNILNDIIYDSHSFLNRLFWIQDTISEEELVWIESETIEGIDKEYLKKLKNLKYYLNLLHCKVEAQEDLKKQLPKRFNEMPSEVKLSMYAGIKSMVADYQPDFSLSIFSFSKCLEIIIKNKIFDEYRIKRGVDFFKQSETLVLSKNDSKAKRLALFIEKPPHHIELGGMEFVLNLKGGKTEKKETLLRDFFKFIEEETEFSKVLDTEFLGVLEIIRKKRNSIVHGESVINGHEAGIHFLHVVKCLEILLIK